MTDGAITKTHIVTRLRVTQTDVDTDRVYGIATPDSTIGIFFWDLDGNSVAWRDVPVDGDGNWMADFTIPVDGQTFDIVDGVSGETFDSDEDQDNSNFRWPVPYIPVCIAGTTATGTVVGPEGEPIADATIHFDDFYTGEPLFTTWVGENGAYGCSLPEGNYRIWADGGGYSREYYNEAIYEDAVRVHVTAEMEYDDVNFMLGTPTIIYDHLTFNLTDPIVGSLFVRQAIAFGTDRARIIATTYPYSPMMDTYLPPDHWAYAVNGIPQYGYNPHRARLLLALAGWLDRDGDGVREKNGVRLHLLYVTTDSELRAAVAQIFVENMADIGIEIDVQALPPSEVFGADGVLERHDFDIAQFAWVLDANDDASVGAMFESESPDNVGLYDSLLADWYLATAAARSSRAEKLPFLQHHQRRVMLDLATLPLFERIEAPSVDSFVVFGQEGIWLKNGTKVVSGNVAANVATDGPYLSDSAEVVIASDVRFLDPASDVRGDTVRLQAGARVYDVYANELTGSADPLGQVYTPVVLPIVPGLPVVPEVLPGTQNFDVPKNGTLTLDAGQYGKLESKKGATIIFTGGVYHFTEWSLGQDVKMYFAAPTEIRIAGKLDIDSGAYIGPAPSSSVTAHDIFIIVLGENGKTGKIGANPKAANFDSRTTLIANVYAPNGTLRIHDHSNATGAFFGRWVEIGQDVKLTIDNGWR